MSKPNLYIKGKGIEVVPGVFIEEGTKLYCKCSIQGKMQRIAFEYARLWYESHTSINKAIEILKGITYTDSQEYFPAPIGYSTSQERIIQEIEEFARDFPESSVWFPKNAWTFDTELKEGVVGSDGRTEKYYHFNVEAQFRQVTRSGIPNVTNDCWAFYTDRKVEKFYQIKEWLDGRVRRLQNEVTITGEPTLVLDFDNINMIPWPPITPGKEQCIIPVTVKSGCVP